MSAGIRNITINQGSDYSETYNIKVDGVLLPLTGFSGRAQMRASPNDASPTATFVVALTDPGVVKVSLGFAITDALTPGKYKWDLEIFADDNSSVTTYLRGTCRVIGGMTK